MATVRNSRRPVAERVFASLLEALLTGRYRPGERLPAQRALAADLAVTMTALREALKRLEQMGLIEVRHGESMKVRDWRRHGGLDVIAPLLLRSGGVDAGVLADVMEARTLMLAELAALAARRRSPAQARRLTELADGLADAPDDGGAQAIDFAFFTEMAEAAGNLVFVLVLNSIRELYFRHAALLPVTAEHAELDPLYRRAAAAIAGRSEARARAATVELAERQRERVQRALSGSRAGAAAAGGPR